jgi:hypothetical protein
MNSWCDIGATWRVPRSWRKPDGISPDYSDLALSCSNRTGKLNRRHPIHSSHISLVVSNENRRYRLKKVHQQVAYCR